MKIFCVGRNYVEHARELDNPVPEKPVIFIKPSTALLVNKKPFFYPDFTNDLQYEGELVLRICKNGKHVQEKFAHKYYDAVTVGLDLTARDLQKECKEKGLPWEIAKGFDGSAVVGRFIKKPASEDAINFTINKNGATVQQGDTGLMLFSFPKIIAYISRYFTLHTKDLIFTGTPAGVGPLKKGDRLEGFIDEELLLSCIIK